MDDITSAHIEEICLKCLSILKEVNAHKDQMLKTQGEKFHFKHGNDHHLRPGNTETRLVVTLIKR